ncbi:hypothetical protein RhiirA1_471076 [Rhizophagus irregularis]|uniref:Uncharacterized protein n=1 Tax=Rhizophagus irregularis TaxID=588596 RepID=A0A2N0R4Y1_9GLOM|nr:hypothetical protein RhiirA1_471076 [Rhizophagus irregularis]
MAFSKTAKGVQINSIISEHNHSLNPLIIETAPKFQRLTNEMLEKIKFWIIEGKMKMSNQYNLLVAFFSDKTINRKDLIVNNNFRNLIVAVALLEDETEIIKEKLNQTSRISEVVEEVQAIFDKQLKKALMDDFYQIDIAREDNYDQPQSLLSSLLGNIIQHNVQEIWKANYAKKTLDYTIQADKLNELISQPESFIEEMKEELSNNQENIDSIVKDPIQVKHKG